MITQIKHLERFVLQMDLFGDQDFINHICGSERRIPTDQHGLTKVDP